MVDAARDLRITAAGEQHSAGGVGGVTAYRLPIILVGLSPSPEALPVSGVVRATEGLLSLFWINSSLIK